MWCIRHLYERRSFSQHQAKIWTFKLSPIRKISLCKKKKCRNRTSEIHIQPMILQSPLTSWFLLIRGEEVKSKKKNRTEHENKFNNTPKATNFHSCVIEYANVLANTCVHRRIARFQHTIPFPSIARPRAQYQYFCYRANFNPTL